MFESDNVDEKIIQKKIVFSTFHSIKGRQRKYVFVLGFDQGYMRFYGRNLPQDLCPSTLYVACTRATEGMVVMERCDFENDRPLEFLKKTQFEMKRLKYIDFKGMPYYAEFQNAESELQDEIVLKHFVTPTDLIKFIPETVLESITPRKLVEFPQGIDVEQACNRRANGISHGHTPFTRARKARCLFLTFSVSLDSRSLISATASAN
jgi:hypothetical protein